MRHRQPEVTRRRVGGGQGGGAPSHSGRCSRRSGVLHHGQAQIVREGLARQVPCQERKGAAPTPSPAGPLTRHLPCLPVAAGLHRLPALPSIRPHRLWWSPCSRHVQVLTRSGLTLALCIQEQQKGQSTAGWR